MSKDNAPSTKEMLIAAGIHELRENGYAGFSIRRVAAACGVSCAAPYRHFKNKDDFILSIFKFINRKWYLTQNRVLCEYPGVEDRLTELGVAYVRFLLDNPDCFLIILERSGSDETEKERSILNSCVRGLINQYCKKVGMSDADRVRKTYIVQSLVFGAALMIYNGELTDSDETFEFIRSSVRREFTIE